MATVIKKCKWSDDEREKQYEATLEFQTVSNTFQFDKGDGSEKIYFSLDNLGAMLSCLLQMRHRIEVSSMDFFNQRVTDEK